MTLGVHLSLSYLFGFSYCSQISQGKNTEGFCHSLLQWITFCQNSPPWPIHLGWSDISSVQFSSVQSLSHVWLFATPWTAARQASLSVTNSQSPPKPMSIELMMPSNHLILCHPLLLLASIFPSIRVFSSESALHIRWPKYWSFSFNISPSNEHPGLISFRMDWIRMVQKFHWVIPVHRPQASCILHQTWTGMGWYGEGGGRRGSGWGTCVHPWQIHVDVWQNQYNIVK